MYFSVLYLQNMIQDVAIGHQLNYKYEMRWRTGMLTATAIMESSGFHSAFW